MYKVDLHTHSIASPDGSITPEQYARALQDEILDYIAITDHNRVDFALGLQKALGDKIIVGEEINTADGELVGLFLHRKIEPGMSAEQTAHAIRDQGGLVYVPHPFETIRKGLAVDKLDAISNLIDIVEVCNGRALLQNRGIKAAVWAKTHAKAGASSSDAHGFKALGYYFSVANEPASRGALVQLLCMQEMSHRRPPLYTLLYPKFNRLTKRLGIRSA